MSSITEYSMFLFLTLTYWKLTGSLKILAMSEYIYLSFKVPDVSWRAILLSWSMSQSVQNPDELLIRMWRVHQNKRFFSALKTDAGARDMAQWVTLSPCVQDEGMNLNPSKPRESWMHSMSIKRDGKWRWDPWEACRRATLTYAMASQPTQKFCLKQAEGKGQYQELSSDLQMHTHIHAH